MIKKSVFLILFIFVLVSAFAQAKTAAYVVRSANVKEEYVDILEDMDFTVDLIDDGDIPTTDFSGYDMILVGNGPITNRGSIPVTDKESIIATDRQSYVDDWHIADYSSPSSSSGYAYGKIKTANIITEGLTSPVQLYDTTAITLYILPYPFRRAPGLRNILSTTGYQEFPIIGIIDAGGGLFGGGTANAKTVFFGMFQPEYWTPEAEQMFRNSVLWLTVDIVAPQISNIIVNVTDESASISWDTDKIGNSSVYYGLDTNLDFIESDPALADVHIILLENLEEDSTYYYKVESCNEDGFCSESSIFDFLTLDFTPPHLVSMNVVDITNYSVNISIIREEDSNLTLYYGVVDEDSLDNKVMESSFGTESKVFIDGLSENTEYFYMAEVCDIYSNCENSSVDSFTTFDFTPPNAPENLILEVINIDNSIMVKWDAPIGEEIAVYNIYASDIPSGVGFDFENPDASTALTEYMDNSASLEQQRYYIVRAEDAAGNEEENENIVGKFDLELVMGYNLVSFPLMPFNNSVDEVMHQDFVYHPVTYIHKYDIQSEEFQIIYHDYKISGNWNTSGGFDELNALEGYFFFSHDNINFTIVGYPSLEMNLGLSEGMNLVGLTLFDDKQIEEV